MAFVVTFAVTLVVAVLVSGFVSRSVLSTAVLFLLAGFLVGRGVLGYLPLRPEDRLVGVLAQAALFAVLFTDGTHATYDRLRDVWRLPGRALLFGMPLTFGGNLLLTWALTPFDFAQSALVAAVLTPTDPVFASAIVGRKEVPRRLRELLNVESGLNDGLALPVVLILLSVVGSKSHSSTWVVLGELVAGVAIGIATPLVVLGLERTRFFGAAGRYEPLNAFAIAVLVFAICALTAANPYLAAFAAGSTLGSVSPEVRASFDRFGELVSELAMLAALLVFGALLTPDLLASIGPSGYLLAVLLLVLVRPVAVVTALAGSRLTGRETAAAAWFGPKGFASVTYGLIVLSSGAPLADAMFRIIAVTTAISIVAHSSTDTVIARWFSDQRDPELLWRRRLLRRWQAARRLPAGSGSTPP